MPNRYRVIATLTQDVLGAQRFNGLTGRCLTMPRDRHDDVQDAAAAILERVATVVDWPRLLREASLRHHVVHPDHQTPADEWHIATGVCGECLREALLADQTGAQDWRRTPTTPREHTATDWPATVAANLHHREAAHRHPYQDSTIERSAELEALDLAEVDGRTSATCPDPDHPTWLRAPDDTRGCPWCRVGELEQAAAWSDADHARRAGVHDLVDRAIEKGYTSIFTDELADALGPDPDPDTEADRAATRTTGPRYPLSVVLPGGRVRHFARLIGDGPAVTTLCRKRGTPTGDGEGRPWCRSCSNRPNPQDQRSTTT